MFFPRRLLLALLLLFALQQSGSAFVLNGYRWANGSDIVIHLQLSRPPANHFDGSSWNASAADALEAWNEHLATVGFTATYSSGASGGDGKSSVFFSNSIYGEVFGPQVLAVTLNYSGAGSVFTETDIIFNNNETWGTYRGPTRTTTDGGYIFDLHRVALHEFGHVLGLGHPDTDGQSNVAALMNSVIEDLDQLTEDDINGGRHLYGNAPLNATLGSSTSYQVASRFGGTFSAANLPPGLKIDPQTGVITGVPEISGSFRVSIYVAGAQQQTLLLDINVTVPAPPNTGVGALLATLPLRPDRFLADPVRPRMYATSPESNSLAVIDTGSFTIIKTIPVGVQPHGMAVSNDGQKLWVANRGSNTPGISVIDLVQLTSLPGINTPFATFDVAEGGNNRLYATSAGFPTNLMRFNAATGAHEGSTSTVPVSEPAFVKATPDRSTLFLAESGRRFLVKFDVTGPEPVLMQSRDLAGTGKDLVISPDGAHVLYPGGGNTGFPLTSTAKLHTADIQTDAGFFTSPGSNAAAVFSGDGAVLYQSLFATSGPTQVVVFDADTRQRIGEMKLIDGISDPLHIALDNTGRALFSVRRRIYGGVEEVRVHSTGRTNTTPPPQLPRAKSLLNVSTRLAAQQGDGVLIAGFIITGQEPKKVALRAIGPSMPVQGRLNDPRLELRGAGGALLATNDNWNAQRAEVLASGLPPANEYEAVIIATLPPGSYTAILQGVNGTTGVGLVELYDLAAASNSNIANISTRGKVETNDNVMIGGFIIGSGGTTRVIVRALGPSLTAHGVTGALADPTLDLHDANGTRFTGNDDWRADQLEEIEGSGLQPADDREAAVIAELQPGGYTAIVRGRSQTTGIALVEVFNLEPQ